MKYVKGFDTLRALAILLVIFDHWQPAATSAPASFLRNRLWYASHMGVNLFFVLSGFLITSILLKEAINKEGKSNLQIVKTFFIRRTLRIFPIYYLSLFALFLINYPDVRQYFAYYATYTSNLLPYFTNKPNALSHTWSLSVEEQFYLIWPWLIILLKRQWYNPLFICCIIVGFVTKLIAINVFHHTYPVLAYHCIDSFAFGALYANARLTQKGTELVESGVRIFLPISLFILVIFTPFIGHPLMVGFFREVDNLICLSLVIFTMNLKPGWFRTHVMENRAINYIGKISYGIYLYHYTFGGLCENFIYTFAQKVNMPVLYTNFFLLVTIKSVTLIILCALSFKLVEKPILKLKEKFEYKGSGELAKSQ